MNRLALLLLLIAAPLWSQEYSPALKQAQATRLFWGDLHVHSNNSPDSFAFGNTGLTAEDAYRFARGGRVTASGGLDAQLSTPLDFLLVADHAEFLGVFPKLLERNPAFLETELGSRWRKILDETREKGWSLVDQELEVGLVSIAIPLRDRSGRMAGAINIGCPTVRATPEHMIERILPPLRDTAEQITRALAR